MRNRVVAPLNASVYFVSNVPTTEEKSKAEAIVRSTFSSADLRHLEVYVQSNASLGPRCFHGALQTEGLRRCWHAMNAACPSCYDWVVRLRTDVHVPFVLHSLPLLSVWRPRDRAVVGFVAQCTLRTGTGAVGMACACVDDEFALLPGAKVQRAYLLGFGGDFCKRRSEACAACHMGHRAESHATPECKLGHSLALRGIEALDLRLASERMNHAPMVHTSCQTVEPLQKLPPISILPAQIERLPHGPWRENKNYVLPSHKGFASKNVL